MTIDEIKTAINNDNKLPDDVRNTIKQDLNNWLSKIGELYQLSPAMELYTVGLNSNHHTVGDYIEITNIFRLYTILDVKLYATQYGKGYMICCNALGYKFMELVSEEVYNQIYKSMSDTVSTYNMFHPYQH